MAATPGPPHATIKAFYWSWQWRQLRAARRSIDGNRCVQCGSDEDLQVDHVIPIRDRWDLRANVSNLVTLCQLCHKAKTRQQRRARSQPRHSRRAAALLREMPT